MKYDVTVYFTGGTLERFICSRWDFSDKTDCFGFWIDNEENGKWIVPKSSIVCFYSEDHNDEDDS